MSGHLAKKNLCNAPIDQRYDCRCPAVLPVNKKARYLNASGANSHPESRYRECALISDDQSNAAGRISVAICICSAMNRDSVVVIDVISVPEFVRLDKSLLQVDARP